MHALKYHFGRFTKINHPTAFEGAAPRLPASKIPYQLYPLSESARSAPDLQMALNILLVSLVFILQIEAGMYLAMYSLNPLQIGYP